MKCDLHIHSTCSDGSLSIQQIVDISKANNLDCISLTDHDTITGTQEFIRIATQAGLKAIPGVELSTVVGEKEVHILVYGYSTDNPQIFADVEAINDLRNQRNRELARLLAQHGMPIDLDSLAKEGSVGRPVIAREMVRLGYVSDVIEAFNKYIGKGMPCYATTERITPYDAIDLAKRYNAYAVLAHPRNLKMSYVEFDKFLRPLVKHGLAGIEANYFTHTKGERKFYNKLAKKYHLMATGGSDYHDHTHGIQLGTMFFEPNAFTEKRLLSACKQEQDNH